MTENEALAAYDDAIATGDLWKAAGICSAMIEQVLPDGEGLWEVWQERWAHVSEEMGG